MSRRSIKELPVDQATPETLETPEMPAAPSSLSERMTAVLDHDTDESEQSPVADSLGKSWWNNVVDVVMGRDEAGDRPPSDEDFAALPNMDAVHAEPNAQSMLYTLAGADDGAPDDVYRPRAASRFVPQYELPTDLATELSERRHRKQADEIDAVDAVDVAGPTAHREPSSSMWGLIGATLALLTVLLAGLAFVLGERSAGNNSTVQLAPVTNTVTSVATTAVTTTATATATKVVVSTPPASTVTATPPASTTTVTTTVTPPPPPPSTVIRTQTQTVQEPNPSTQATEGTQATDAPAATDTTQ